MVLGLGRSYMHRHLAMVLRPAVLGIYELDAEDLDQVCGEHLVHGRAEQEAQVQHLVRVRVRVKVRVRVRVRVRLGLGLGLG